MERLHLDAGIAAMAVTSPRFSFLGQIGTDLSTIGTWDPGLSRRTRILVPVDVQAFVVRADPEPVVRVTGRPDDEEPFADGEPPATGVHLHWALPDALLRARHDQGTKEVVAPSLPDQWVVVRTLQPTGRRQVVATGWVIDAQARTCTPMAEFTGPGEPSAELPNPLTLMTEGPMWTATYAASADRFAFHDPLEDLQALRDSSAPAGFAGDQAVYTVAGWWRDPTADPLAHARGSAGLDRALKALGWRVDHDANDEDRAEPEVQTMQLMAAHGLKQPVEDPSPQAYRKQGSKLGGALHGVTVGAAYPVAQVSDVWLGEQLPKYHALLHGSVLGVPVAGELPAADGRPDAAELSVAVGTDADDVVAAFSADGLGLGTDARRLSEDLMAAFSMGAVNRLGTTDGLDEVAQREHENGFWSLPGAALPASRGDRLRVADTLAAGPSTVGRKGRGAQAAAAEEVVAELSWRSTFDLADKHSKSGHSKGGHSSTSQRKRVEEAARPPTRPTEEARTVTRPAPRYFRPQPLVVALRGARPSHRHHGDGLFDSTGKLVCRYPRAAVPRWDGLVDGAAVLPTLGSGAVPDEVLTVVREAVLLNPYAADWLAEAGAPTEELLDPFRNRMVAELVRLHGTDGRYTGTTHLDVPLSHAATGSSWAQLIGEERPEQLMVTAALAEHSTMRGTPPSPVALTNWRQPWVPIWLEWEVTLQGRDSLQGWHLDGYDVEPSDGSTHGKAVDVTLQGRGPVGRGVGEALRAAIVTWREAEQRRAVTNHTDPYGSGPVLAQLAALDRPLDLVSASLDGLREQLLGIDFVGQVARDELGKPTASRPPVTLFGGTLRVDRLRFVDAFGRTLSVPEAELESLATTIELEVAGSGRSIRMRPRFQGSARWLLRLLDAGQPPGTPLDDLREAHVDQLDPAAAASPVAGFLLPDHIDETLEAFTAAGAPLGEVGHDPIGAAVRWDPAPGRPVRADAGPLVDIGSQDRLVAEVAAGLVRADAEARALPEDQRPRDSALVTLLRAVDTTLWTVDTLAALGAGTVAGLVGRPVAVVRASLRLDLADDLAEVTVTALGGVEERRAAFERLSDELVEVRIGTLTRSDDAVLGYFVDDDYEHLHVVDKVLAAHARLTGRTVGQLGLLGEQAAPETTTLDHPYVVTDGVLRVRPGRTVLLTLLMLPMGKVHVTSGVLPRKALGLAESWFAPGLKRVMPSVRVGPLLVDPAEIRLPLVNLLGDRQTFSRRTGELSWRNDPIVAATQTAYLPLQPHEVEEGWIRVTPGEDGSGGGG